MIKQMLSEYQTMLKNKILLIVIFIIPIGVNILLGLEFRNNQIQHIPMAVMDEDNSKLSRLIVQQFGEDDIFDIKYYPQSNEEMKSLFDKSKVRVGMIIPEGFSSDVTTLKLPSILMIYDGSHMSIASTAKVKASEILQTLKAGSAIKMVQGKLNIPGDAAKNMVLSIGFNNRMLYNPAKSFKNFLNPGFGVAIVQTGVVLMAAVCIRREELHGEKVDKFVYIIKRVIFFTILGIISMMLSILIQAGIFGVPFRGSFFATLLLTITFSGAISSFAVAVSLWVKDKMIATIVNAIIFIPNSVMVGYTWPVLSMPHLYRGIARVFPFYYYADTLRDLYLKGTETSILLRNTAFLLIFIFIMIFILILGIEILGLRQSAGGKGEGKSELHKTAKI